MSSEAGVSGRLDELLVDVDEQRGGALWNLASSQRQLDANLIRLPPGAGVPAHVEPDLDVLLFVAKGSGLLVTDAGEQRLAPGAVAWLPRGAERALSAGDEGLVYLTAHRRRPGMSIGGTAAARSAADVVPAPPKVPAGSVEDEGGETACLLDQVCPECGRLATERSARYCSQCGNRLGDV